MYGDHDGQRGGRAFGQAGYGRGDYGQWGQHGDGYSYGESHPEQRGQGFRDQARDWQSGTAGRGQGGYGQGDYGRGWQGGEGPLGSAAYRRGIPGRGAGHDHNYHDWRERKLKSYDDEFEAFNEERQKKFDSEFDEWRKRRRSGSDAGQAGSGASANARSGESRSRDETSSSKKS